MEADHRRLRAATERRARARRGTTRRMVESRPDRVAFWAVMLAVVAMVAGAASSRGDTGGLGLDGGGAGAGDARYVQIWQDFKLKDKRWARQTSECESGGDPRAIGGDGRYRGAFQFMRATWRRAPRSPGGDPIRHPWRTQAVVAVSLKHRAGTGAWPNCG
jgi:Transglycosylase-like domain